MVMFNLFLLTVLLSSFGFFITTMATTVSSSSIESATLFSSVFRRPVNQWYNSLDDVYCFTASNTSCPEPSFKFQGIAFYLLYIPENLTAPIDQNYLFSSQNSVLSQQILNMTEFYLMKKILSTVTIYKIVPSAVERDQAVSS